MTKKETLKQIAAGSCVGVVCRHCPIKTKCVGIPIKFSTGDLPPINIDEAKQQLDEMEIDKQIEEFLGEE